MFPSKKRKLGKEQEEQAIRERAAKRAVRGMRNPAVSAEFNQATETFLDALEALRKRGKTYDPGRYTRRMDTVPISTLWGNGLTFAGSHFTTEQEARRVIEIITTTLEQILQFPYAEETLIQQFEAIISERANRTASVVNIAQSMVRVLRESIVTNSPCEFHIFQTLRDAGSRVMALVPYDDYQQLVPPSEQRLENAAEARMDDPAPQEAIQRLEKRTRKIATEEEIDPEDICTVCQEPYQPEERVIEMRCSHVFHETCVQDWLTKRSPKCPVCRRSVSLASSRPGTASSRGTTEGVSGAKAAAPTGGVTPALPPAPTVQPTGGFEGRRRRRARRCGFCSMFLCFSRCEESSGEE